MKFLGVVMALALARVHGRKPSDGDCADDICVAVYTQALDFHSAQRSCEEQRGHLTTVRTPGANRVITDLLAAHPGEFWIGLRYTENVCSGSTQELKGYTWITGDEATNFSNWKKSDAICSPRCVSLSTGDRKWTERLCDRATEGYLCEHEQIGRKCRRLSSESPVLYETPYGFSREDLREVPFASNATERHLGMKFICFEGHWHKAPWNCDVYKGGCEHECEQRNGEYVCTCPLGYTLEGNAVGCKKALGDPCLRANCSHGCVAKGDGAACQCRSGYELGPDGKTCEGANSCKNRRSCPDENSYCVSTAGGFECRCRNGFTMENGRCEDDDECFSSPCEHVCNNTVGSYHCKCADGFRVSAENRHECTLYCPGWECPVVDCDLNNPLQCECPDGFILEERPDGLFCVDIDECDASQCDHECLNTAGGFACLCPQGFDLLHNTGCVETKGSSTTTPPGRFPPMESASVLSAGGILGIIVCAVAVLLLTVCAVHHHKRRCGKITTNTDTHTLQQVTMERYVKKLSIAS